MLRLFSDTHRLDLLEKRLHRHITEQPEPIAQVAAPPPDPTRVPAAVRHHPIKQAFRGWRAHGFSPAWVLSRLPGFRRLARYVRTLEHTPTHLSGLTGSLDALGRQVSANFDTLRRQLRANQEETRDKVESQHALLHHLERELNWLKSDFEAVLRQTESAIGSSGARSSAPDSGPGAGSPSAERPLTEAAPPPSDWYRTYRQQVVGTPDALSDRLNLYLPVIAKAIPDPSDGLVLDIGCGGGDWVGQLQSHGFKVTGVEFDWDLVLDGRRAGRSIRHAPAADDLAEIASGSIAVVTAFHLIERLSIDQLIGFLREVDRVLRPGGRLLLEALDPRYPMASGYALWLDPQRQRMVPAPLLHHLAGYLGFHARSITYLAARARLSAPLSVQDQAAGSATAQRQDVDEASFEREHNYSFTASKPKP